MNLYEILSLTVEDLKTKLAELNLNRTGNKKDLQDRLLEHFRLSRNNDDEDNESNVSFSSLNQRNVATEHPGPMFSLKDIEDSLTKFSGEGYPEVEKWIRDFEDCALTVGWNDLRKYIYARQLLTGAARIFVRSQSNIREWSSLEQSLRREFGTRLSAIEVHKLLKNRKKRPHESFKEYLYSIIEIGVPINLDEESVIEYFVEGIQDSRSNKSILYQATSIDELKRLIKVYEKVSYSNQSSNAKSFRQKPNKPTSPSKNIENVRTCFKCGEKGHIASECKSKGPKCFKCQATGHKSFECKAAVKNEGEGRKREDSNVHTLTSDQARERNDTDLNLRNGCNRIFKDIIVKNRKISAIVDTGSDISCLRRDTLLLMDDVELRPEKKTLIGIGQKNITTLGCFTTTVDLDKVNIPITFHIARESDILYSAVIGNDVLQHVNIICNAEEAKFVRRTNSLEVVVKPTKSDVNLEDVSSIEKLRDEFSQICMSTENELFENLEVELGHLKEKVSRDVRQLIEEYSPVKPTSFPVQMKIILNDDIPVCHRPRRMSYADQMTVDRQVREWLEEGIVKKSTSEYASPVVLVSKKDGTKRLCCDYRKLNEKIVRDNFPMAIIEDVLQRLQGARLYTTLDLRSGFFHVPIENESTKYTAFVTHQGQFEFLYVPFGISNSPAVFCRYITALFQDLIRDGTMVVYMDDIVIPSQDETDGLQKLRKVLQVAQNNGLNIKWEKCQILMSKITFLGYIIENSTILPSREKTSAVVKFPTPRDRKSIERFLGLTSYFRQFIPDYALVARPLSNMLRKDISFKMGDSEILAFEQLKSMLAGAGVLRLYNPRAETEVHCDASKFGYGAILLQKDSNDGHLHPVEFLSRKTTPAEEKYHSYELEVLSIIKALKKWRVFLMGMQFKIITDCNAFALTMRKDEVPVRVARWALFLQDYNYIIEHRSGSRMRHVDALSRVSCLMTEDTLRHRLRNAQLSDNWTKVIRKILESTDYEDFYMKYDILHKDSAKELIVVPKDMEREIIDMAHRNGHFSSKKTRDLVEKNFYIPDLQTKVENVVKNCVECIMAEAKMGKREGFLNPIDKSDKPLTTFHLDHVGPMETTQKQYNHILVIVDAFSKFVWLYPTKSTGTLEVVDRLRRQAAIFGNPERVITDRGSAFLSNAFKEYCQSEKIQHLLIATGVPRGNGQVERIHRIIIPMLTKLCLESPQNWYKHVDKVQQIINDTPSRSTGNTPFKILTGLDMRSQRNPDFRKILDELAEGELHQERDLLREGARENILRIQRENKKSFDKKRVAARVYNINDLVAVKRTQFGTGMKLKPKYLGPYKVIEKMNHGRYVVEKIGESEGSRRCTTVAEFMKPWSDAFGSKAPSGRPNVGSEYEQRRSERLREKRTK